MGIKETFSRNIGITRDMRDRFKKIEMAHKIFRDRDLKYFYMLCVGLGYASGRPDSKPKEAASIGLVNVASFEENELWALASIAIEQKGGDLKVIEDGAEIKRTCTAYASSGLGILEGLLRKTGGGDAFLTELEKMGVKSVKGR